MQSFLQFVCSTGLCRGFFQVWGTGYASSVQDVKVLRGWGFPKRAQIGAAQNSFSQCGDSYDCRRDFAASFGNWCPFERFVCRHTLANPRTRSLQSQERSRLDILARPRASARGHLLAGLE